MSTNNEKIRESVIIEMTTDRMLGATARTRSALPV